MESGWVVRGDGSLRATPPQRRATGEMASGALGPVALGQSYGRPIAIQAAGQLRLGLAGGTGILLTQPPELVTGCAWLNRTQATHQVEHVLGRKLTVVLPLQAGRLYGALLIRHKREG